MPQSVDKLKPSVFISHSSKDKAFVRKLVADLKSANLPLWFDEEQIGVGDSIVAKINDGLASSVYILVVLSRSSLASRWVQDELNYAKMRSLTDKSVVILPVILEDCEVPPLLMDKLHADFRKDYIQGLSSLMSAFKSKPEEIQSALRRVRLRKRLGRIISAPILTAAGAILFAVLFWLPPLWIIGAKFRATLAGPTSYPGSLSDIGSHYVIQMTTTSFTPWTELPTASRCRISVPKGLEIACVMNRSNGGNSVYSDDDDEPTDLSFDTPSKTNELVLDVFVVRQKSSDAEWSVFNDFAFNGFEGIGQTISGVLIPRTGQYE
jgi:hypothetical protein